MERGAGWTLALAVVGTLAVLIYLTYAEIGEIKAASARIDERTKSIQSSLSAIQSTLDAMQGRLAAVEQKVAVTNEQVAGLARTRTIPTAFWEKYKVVPVTGPDATVTPASARPE